MTIAEFEQIMSEVKSNNDNAIFSTAAGGGEVYTVFDYSDNESEKLKITLPQSSAFFDEGGSPPEETSILIQKMNGQIYISSTPGLSNEVRNQVFKEILNSCRND